jgi:cysteinyl-tRNA synthetase
MDLKVGHPLEAAHATLRRWRTALQSWEIQRLKFDAEINSALLTQDLDTPRAMQRLRTIEKDASMGSLDKRAIFLYADQVLGLDLDRVDEIKPLPEGAQALLDARVSARAAKEWKRSDDLRDERRVGIRN